jgi:Domain of unknown function (DUF1704)
LKEEQRRQIAALIRCAIYTRKSTDERLEQEFNSLSVTTMSPEFKRLIHQIDARLIVLAKPINVLKHLNWSDQIEDTFLEGWRDGTPALPVVEVRVPDWSKEIAALDELQQLCNGDDTILQFLRRSAWSYAEAGRMLMAAGTHEFTERSINLYGRPNDVYKTQSFNLERVTLDGFVKAER